MKKQIRQRVLSLVLVLVMVLGMVPMNMSTPAVAVTPEEEKIDTRSGTDYTAIIDSLAKPAVSYGKHFTAKNIETVVMRNWAYPLVPLGDYVLLTMVDGKVYAFAPRNLTTGQSTTVDAIPLAMNAVGDYLPFASDKDASDATITFRANTSADYHYERLFVRQDDRIVQPGGNANGPHFTAYNGSSNETYCFFHKTGEDGLELKKNIKYSTESNRVPHYLVYSNGSFTFNARNTDPNRTQNSLFYLYRMYKITQGLYDAITAAKTYATGNGNGTYDPELYKGFISLLEECIELYEAFNRYLTKAEVADVVALQQSLDTRANSLNAYMQVLSAAGSTPNYTTVLSKIPASRGWDNHVVEHNRGSDFRGWDGTYFIVGDSHLMNPTATAPAGRVAATAVTVANNRVTNASLSQAIDLVYEKTADGTDSKSYFFRAQNGKYLRAEIVNGNRTLSWGHAHQSMSMDYIKDSGDSERVFFYCYVTRNTDGTSVPSEKSRFNYDSTNTTFALKKAGEGNSNYRLYRLTWSTEALRAAIAEMASYANHGSGIVPGVYKDFLSCMDESIALYLKYNVAHTAEQLDRATAIQAELKAQVTRLLSYKDILKADYQQVIETLTTPYNELYRGPLSQYHVMNIRMITGGTYYIIAHDTSDSTKGWAMSVDDKTYEDTADNCITAAPVAIRNGRILNATPSCAFNLKESKADNGTLYAYEFRPWPVNNITFYVGKGEEIPDNTHTTGGPKFLNFKHGSQVAFQPTLYNDGFTLQINKNFDTVTGNENYLIQYKPDLVCFRPTLKELVQYPTKYHLYQVSSHVLELYDAIKTMAVYAAGNADDRYPADTYADFLSCLQESIDLYQLYNTSALESWDMAELKEEINAQAEKLLAYVGTLTLSDTIVDYIDIPVEILDFRADGFMFEYGKGGYGLNSIGDLAEAYNKTLANSLKAYNTVTPAGSPSTVAQGLTLPNLVGRNMVYTEKTLKMVAYALMAGLYKQETNIPGQSNLVKRKVDSLYDAAKAYTPESAQWMQLLGSPSDTYSKTSTPDVNGGELSWGKVETAYDLAYYILNYLWRPVSPKDKETNTGDIYNVSVPERAVFRMFRDESTGLYTLDAYSRVECTDSYVYNAYPLIPSSAYAYSPNFTPIDGLGFETPGSPDTDRSQYLYTNNNYSTDGANFHFTVHAKGSFVYYEEQDLYFEFLGDDDVYFYIDGQRVMDLGGGHAAASGTLYLNDKAKDLKLVDGGVYTFDMFYAERKTSASNLRFATNIRIFNTDTQTLKGQYAVQMNGESTVDPKTGRGIPMGDNATIRVGDVIAYSFDLINTREAPVLDPEFHDPSLGVDLSKDWVSAYTGTLADGSQGVSITNPNADYANGVITRVSDIFLEYCALDTGGKPLSQEVTEITAGELLPLLNTCNRIPDGVQSNKFTSPDPGVYRVRIESSDDLKKLLEAGLPMKCSLSIYGFLRKTKAEDLPYENHLTTKCYYPSSTDSDAELIPIIGSASRQIRVLQHSSMPQVRRLDIVLDYGKAVAIPLEDIEDLVRFEDGSPVKIGSVVGFLRNGYNGKLLKKEPDDLVCTEQNIDYPVTQGAYRLVGDSLVFEPKQFLTQVDTLYGVVEVDDFYYGTDTTEEFRYILVELRLTPAHVMYYETDFAPNIFTLTQAGSFEDSYERKEDVYPNWTPIDDKTGSADPYQDYERLNGTVYHTDIDPEYIPAEAFFVDFDGEGYERRYRDNPQYGNRDFDKPYWATMSGKVSINTVTGVVAFPVSTSTTDGAYLTTVGDTTGTWPTSGTPRVGLALYGSDELYVQMRFKMDHCSILPGKTPQVQFTAWYQDPDTATYYYDDTMNAVDLDPVMMGKYQTVSIPIPADAKFLRSHLIRNIGFHFMNIKGSNSTAAITVDYIYVGPEMGMEDDIYGNYLFVGFDNTPEVPLRYSSSIYGTDSRFNTAYRPLDTAGAWESSSAKDSIRIQKGLEGDANNGYIYFEDKLDDSKLDAKATKNYSYIHAGAIATGNGIYNYPINYTPTLNDFCQIRIKIENGGIVPEQVLGLGIEYSKGNICGKANLDTSHLDGNFHTITFPLDAPYWKKHWVENKAKLNWLHPVVYNLRAKNGATTGAKITIDYIFIGPEHMLDRVSQHAKPGAEQVNHLFFDFNNNDAAKVRYTYPIYGSTATNYDLQQNWSVDTKVGDTEIVKMESGAIVFKDKDSTITWNYIHSAAKYWEIPLAFVPGKNDYLRIRMKIDKGTAGTAPNGTMTVALENFEGDNFFSYGARDYSFADYADGVYHIFTVPLDKEDYLKEDVLTAVRPVISGTQNCTFTVDYIYVGPLTEGNPSAPSLYFGFGDRGSGHWNTDRLRYDSDTYGFLNYDTNRWLSESEAVTSSLTQNIYGWKTAGNENRGNPVDAAIKDYVPPFPPTENVSYPNVAVAPKPDTGNLEVVVEAAAGTTADTVAIQTYPSISSPRYYWRHFMQTLNYHPAEENIVQVRFRTEGLTIKDNFAVKLMYLPTGASAFCTSDPLKLAPQMPLNPEEDYVIMTAQLDDTFDNAPAIERLRLVFEGVAAEKGDKILIDYVYAGVGRLAPEPVYGYDSSYLNDTKLSNGSSYVVTGRGVKAQYQTDKYTEASFSFRGTGFDIISRTDMNQGTIRVEVWKKGADKTKDKAEKILTVNNKGELELFQIPVVSVQGLKYGDYDVTLWVNAPVKSSYEFLNHKGNFHFDAVRIYDPMGEDTGLASEILYTYLVDTEGYASVKEVRNILLSAEDFASQLTSQSGAIFVDSAEEPTVTVPATDASGDPIPSSTATIVPEGITVNNHITASATTYDKIGPKNEVYLAPGQAVAFMLKISTTYVPTSVDVAVKTIKANEPANLVAGIVKKEDATATKLLQVAGRRDITVGSATELYYALPIDASTFYMAPDGDRYCYIVLYNNGSTGTITNVLSVTDIKVAYDEQPEVGLPRDAVTDTEIQKRSTDHEESYYDFVVDGHTLHAAALVMKAALETPLLAEGTKLMHSLNLASDISVNYAVLKDSMADYTDFYLQVRIPGRAEALRIDPVEKGIHYYFTLDGLTAVQMTDVLEATLYMEKAGRIYRSETDYYSIAQYAYTQLRKDTVSTELKTLCAELLRYGSKAQIFKSYGLDRLADGDMTAQDRAYLTDIDAVTFGNTNRVLGDLPDASIVWAGKSLSLESKVALKFVFNPADDIGDLSALTLRMSYTDTQGMTKTVTVSNPELYNESLGYYVFTVDTLLAAELRAVVSVQIYAGDTPVSATLEYSPDTYGNNKTGALLDLCRALFAYCDSAKAFFA